MSGHTPTPGDQANTPPQEAPATHTLIQIGPGRVTSCRVLSGRGRSTMDSVRLFDARPSREHPTFLCSFMLPAQGGVATRLNYAYSGDLLASGNLTSLVITGTRLRDDGQSEEWSWSGPDAATTRAKPQAAAQVTEAGA